MPTYTRKTGKLEKVGAVGTEGRLELAGEKRCWGCEEDRGCKDTCSTKEIYMCKVPGRIETHLWRMKSSPWLQSSVGISVGRGGHEGEAGAFAGAQQEGRFTV